MISVIIFRRVVPIIVVIVIRKTGPVIAQSVRIASQVSVIIMMIAMGPTVVLTTIPVILVMMLSSIISIGFVVIRQMPAVIFSLPSIIGQAILAGILAIIVDWVVIGGDIALVSAPVAVHFRVKIARMVSARLERRHHIGAVMAGPISSLHSDHRHGADVA